MNDSVIVLLIIAFLSFILFKRNSNEENIISRFINYIKSAFGKGNNGNGMDRNKSLDDRISDLDKRSTELHKRSEELKQRADEINKRAEDLTRKIDKEQ